MTPSFAFDGKRGLVIVEAEMTGPAKTVALRLALDTGATTSQINVDLLKQVGCTPDAASPPISMMTGSRMETVRTVILTRLSALGHHRIGAASSLTPSPEGVAVDGVLGLDFLRDRELRIDFRSGRIALK